MTKDWAKYDGAHAVFEPAGMTVGELERGQNRFWLRYNSPDRIVRRKIRQVKNVGLANAAYLALA